MLTTQVAASGGIDDIPGRRVELAADLAQALLELGARDPQAALHRADELGLPTMGQVWSDADPTSRAGLLWTLHLVRAWCVVQAEDAVRLFGEGRGLAPVAEVVAGLPWAAGARDVAELGERLLLTAYAGRLGAAAERAAAFVSVLAEGVGHQPDRRPRLLELERRLAAAGRAGRAGGLR